MLQLHGPDNQLISVNPWAVVSTRAPRKNEHFGEGVKCIIHMADGKFITVIETCAEVNRRLEEGE